MPAKRKRSSGATKRRRTTRVPRKAKYTRKKPLALKTHTFSERSTITTNLAINSEAAAVGMIKEFSLNEISQSGSYIALFEEYQLNKVIVNFRYKSIGQYGYETGAALNMNEVNPVLYFKVDHNDDTLESLADLKKSTKTREYQFTNSKPNFSVAFKLACLMDVSNIHGALGIAHRPKWKQWLPTDESAVSHFGLKAYCVAATSAAHVPGSLEVTYKLYFSLKNNE